MTPTLPLDTLMSRLRTDARGWYAAEAATELLIGHDHWLHRGDFLAACVGTDTDPTSAGIAAWIDWEEVPAFLEEAACSSSEARILALAAELAGSDSGRQLGELLVGLDDRNAQLVLDAIGHVLALGGRRPITLATAGGRR